MTRTRSEHSFVSTMKRIAASGRVYVGLVTNALSSLGNFAVSIALARTLGLTELGAFAIAFAAYAFVTGLVRAAVSEPLLAVEASAEEVRAFSRRASMLALVAGAATLAIGGILAAPYLIVVGVCMHGLVVFDYAKTMNLAAFRRSFALYQEIAWFGCGVIAGVLIASGVVTGLTGFAVWAAAGSLIGYMSAGIQKYQLHPTWFKGRVSGRQAAAFGGDFVVGSGSAQISFNLIGVGAGLSVLGAVRAGAILLGPISLVVGSARTLAIPFLTRRIALGASAARSGALAATITIASVAAPLLALVAFLPDSIGAVVLGKNWTYASVLLPFLALEMLFISLATVPFAGFRALLAGKASLVLRSVLALIRMVIVPTAAIVGGAIGAAVALAILAALSTCVWWIGYLFQLKRTLRGAE